MSASRDLFQFRMALTHLFEDEPVHPWSTQRLIETIKELRDEYSIEKTRSESAIAAMYHDRAEENEDRRMTVRLLQSEVLGLRDTLCRIEAALGPGAGPCDRRVAQLVAGMKEAPYIVSRLEGDGVAEMFATELVRYMNGLVQ